MPKFQSIVYLLKELKSSWQVGQESQRWQAESTRPNDAT